MSSTFGIEFPGGVMDGAIEIFRSCERLMSEVVPLQVAPDRFNVVELWGVVRQPLDAEPVGAFGERSAACRAGVDRTVVENEHDGLERDPELGAKRRGEMRTPARVSISSASR